MVKVDVVALRAVNNWPKELWPTEPFDYDSEWLTKFKKFMESEAVNIHPPPEAFYGQDAAMFAEEFAMAAQCVSHMKLQMATLKSRFFNQYKDLCFEFKTAPTETHCITNFIDFEGWSINTKPRSPHLHALDNWLFVRMKALFATAHWKAYFDDKQLDEQSESEEESGESEEDELMESDSDEEESELEEESDASEDQESDGEDDTAPTENAAESKQP